MTKLNFGSARDRIEGFKNVDALDWEGNTDIIWDMNKFPYPFKDDSADEIRSVECLEHISFKNTTRVLKEWYRIMKKGGQLYIQVPNAGLVMEYYVKNQICECCAHKPIDFEDAKGKEDCPKCRGRGEINPTRWLYTFTGASKHDFDNHLNIFTKEILEDNLKKANFKDIEVKDDKYGWKLKISCKK